MDEIYLKQKWEDLTKNLPDAKLQMYEQLVKLYRQAGRHYHTLTHIENLLRLIDEFNDRLTESKTLEFAAWYHDAIYRVTTQDSEKRSAELARDHMQQLGIDEKIISPCYELILATKTHQLPETLNSTDYKFFLDIDLSILAAEREAYLEYTRQIRKEFWIYPGLLYRKGRKKVLQHFLEKERIYQTDFLYEKWEQKARENLKYELEVL